MNTTRSPEGAHRLVGHRSLINNYKIVANNRNTLNRQLVTLEKERLVYLEV